MSQKFPQVYLARHGETEWSLSGQHTGRTDIPLTAKGEDNARRLGQRLQGLSFAQVFTSPLVRARRTCELAGFTGTADPDLLEWNYGDYEGAKTADIRKQRADWQLFRDGGPNGETAAEVGARCDRVIAKARAAAGNVLLFAHGHVLRVLAARWVGLPAVEGRRLVLGTAALCLLGYEHNLEEPVICLWNDTSHVGAM